MSRELEQIIANAARWRSNGAECGVLRATMDESQANPLSSMPLKYVVMVNAASDRAADLYASAVVRGLDYTSGNGRVFRVCLEDFRMVSREGALRIYHSNSARAPQLVEMLLHDQALKCGVFAIPLKTFAH
jgi:hypothetical protein